MVMERTLLKFADNLKVVSATDYRRLEHQIANNFALRGEHLFGDIKANWSVNTARASETRPDERYISYREKDVTMSITSDAGEYGFLQMRPTNAVDLLSFGLKELTNENQFQFQLVTSFQAAGQVEGMVVDYADRILYLGEEQGGVYAYNLDDMWQERFRVSLSGVENEELAYDIEGLAIYAREDFHLLVTSSQGNNRFAVYNIDRDYTFLGVFGIEDVYGDRVQETDGIDNYSGAFGEKYPAGIFMCQDGFNYDSTGTKEPQNFKITDWRLIEHAFGL